MLDLSNNKLGVKSVEFFESDINHFEKHEIKEIIQTLILISERNKKENNRFPYRILIDFIIFFIINLLNSKVLNFI
jgi:hypothetical protein